ncbi:LTA synthase family protein [Paenibacillus sp. 1011MAR3C5]|uniref:LTA synthase family protein n=1 Tax=Paenibacillus sp. 1011MAR3C5 TaxID=1675787 RepID=UPI000E6C4D37|nr:LTA synthase family protein [Paenibacillus sp. 1011MAR3C5]RJE88519.1 LTA synthase family protein [Paenibacillus sp. 1011MAR3C5]
MNSILNVYRKAPFWTTFILIMLKMALFRQFTFDGVQIDRLLSDGAAVLVLLCVLELITTSRWKTAVMGVGNAVISLLLFACSVYYSFFGSIPTYTALHGLGQVGQVKESVESAIELKFYVLFLDLAILLVLYVLSLRSKGDKTASRPAAKPIYVGAALIIAIGASFFYIRSDLDISNELVQAERLGVLNYQIATAVKENKENTAIKNGSTDETKQALEQLEENFYGGGSVEAGTPNFYGVAKGKNVIVIQLESFQNLMIGLKVNGQEVTPVLNDLIANGSFYFPKTFQQIGQGNTSDAEFISNTGVYPTGTIAMSKGYGDRKIPSLPRLLAEQNYTTNTFHVNDVTFWDRNKLYPALGFDKYYDRPFFKDDKFNGFGASDGEMYRVGLERVTELHDEGKPFYAQFVTTSSHHPFWVKSEFLNIKLPPELSGTQMGHYVTAINYTDKALGDFIENLKEKGIWEDTILVAYGDHFGLQTKENDPAWVEEVLGVNYHDQVSRFNIPFLVHVPGVEGKTMENVAGQVDMMPTIVNLLGISLKEEGHTVFGQDLLNAKKNVIGMRYYMPTGTFFNDEIMFVPGKGFEDGTAIDLKTLEPVKDFSKYRSDYDYVLELMKLSDEYMKLLPQR